MANYVTTLRKEVLQVAWACGVEHPAHIALDRLELLDGISGQRNAAEVLG
jgi:hypothetical protein